MRRVLSLFPLLVMIGCSGCSSQVVNVKKFVGAPYDTRTLYACTTLGEGDFRCMPLQDYLQTVWGKRQRDIDVDQGNEPTDPETPPIPPRAAR